MYELQAIIFGYPFSRWIIEVLEPSVRAYNNPAIIAVANATTEIIRFGLGNEDVASFLSTKNPVEIISAGIRLLEMRAQGEFALDLDFVTENTTYKVWGKDHPLPKLKDEDAEENFKELIEKLKEGNGESLTHSRRTARRPKAAKQTNEAAEALAKPVKSSTANLFKTKANKTYKSAEIVIDSDDSDEMDLDTN